MSNRRVHRGVTSSAIVRFRHHQAIWVAAVIAFFGTVPIASIRWYLAPLLLVPALVGIWAFRSGTDADAAGIRVRALLGQRRIPWSDLVELTTDPAGRTVARLVGGQATTLPAVHAADLPRLVAASGQQVQRQDQ